MSYRGLQVGPHYVRHPADLRILVDAADGRFPRAESISKRFNSDVRPDLVSVLEAVGYGLWHAVDANFHSLDPMLFGSFNEGPAREPHDA